MLIRKLLVLSTIVAVTLVSLTGCQPSDAGKAPPKKTPSQNTTQGKK